MKIFQKRISYKSAGALLCIILFFTVCTIYLLFSARGDGDSKTTSGSTQTATAQTTTNESSNISKDSNEDSSNSDPTQEIVEAIPPITLPASGNTVTITASGFSPATITISAGESVTWVNDSSKNSWPASAPHPQHTDYPGFDSFGIAADSSWSFQFNNTGPSWDYHDHNKPSRKGTVVVQ